MGINKIYKFTLPEAVFVVIYKLVIFFGELLSWDVCVPSSILIGSTMSKLCA